MHHHQAVPPRDSADPTPDVCTRSHSLAADEVTDGLNTSIDRGIDATEAADRLERHGRNRLRPPERDHPVLRFLRHFHNILIYILVAAAAGTALLGHWVDTGVILGVVVINTIIGFVQEGKAERALDSIRQMLSPQAVVLRAGRQQTIAAEELVPGDVVLLNAGDRVPADLRLVRAHNLRIDEAILTGESVPVEKQTDPVAEDTPVAEQACMAHSGTVVAFGQGRGVVVATGEDSQVGRIGRMLSEVESLATPLIRRVEHFGRWLSVIIVGISALTFAFGYWVQGYPLADMFLAAASLAVSTIPEGLPAIMTITLAIGVQKMARRNAIIRRLPAVETLGSVTVICSDKTGTLTRNEMTVQSVCHAQQQIEVTGIGYEPHGIFRIDDQDIDVDDDLVLREALEAVVLCNDAHLDPHEDGWRLVGDPTEGALLVAGVKAGIEPDGLAQDRPRTDLIPFESSYKYMATLHHDHQGNGWILLKGAPEAVLAVCAHQRTADGHEPLDREYWDEVMHDIAARGQRLLAVAAKYDGDERTTLTFDDVADDMVLLAVFGIIDPPSEEAVQAVRECREAGIRVKMITGDHAVTASAIGREMGIGDGGDTTVHGSAVETMDDAELRRAVHTADVFARSSPTHKLRLVEALQADGQIVAMTGDGVNDAPALKRADIGVAMGRKGTEAAKEAAEMVLADDNFASIAHAVEEGRAVYDNIRKAILHMLPTNAGQSLTIMIAIFFGMTLPLMPVQILWVNMVTSVTLAMSLAFLAAEPGVMKRPPRAPDAPLISGFLLWRISFVAIILWAGTFGHFSWMILHDADIEVARTVAINTLVAAQAFYLVNLVLVYQPVLTPRAMRGTRPIWTAIGVLVVLQLAFTYAPWLQVLFGTTAIPLADWLRIITFGALVFVLVEIEKVVVRRLGLDETTVRTERAPTPAGADGR